MQKKKKRQISEETRKKMRESHLGQKPWNLGKKGEYSQWPNGRVFSDETKRKMSVAKKGKPLDPIAKAKMLEWRKNNPELANLRCRLGTKQSPETRAKISRAGSLHYNWQGGKSFEIYPQTWTKTLKLSIRQRDNFMCQICGLKEGKTPLCVHHIDYNKKNCDPLNLISLCNVCHPKTNYKRNYWLNYFKEFYERK